MYWRLRELMASHRISSRSMADALSVHENTIKNKLDGESRFAIDEAFVIRNMFFPQHDLDEIFQRERGGNYE